MIKSVRRDFYFFSSIYKYDFSVKRSPPVRDRRKKWIVRMTTISRTVRNGEGKFVVHVLLWKNDSNCTFSVLGR